MRGGEELRVAVETRADVVPSLAAVVAAGVDVVVVVVVPFEGFTLTVIIYFRSFGE